MTFPFNVKKLTILLFLAAVLFLTCLSFIKPLYQDEGVFLTIGRGIVEGETPYLDFFDHKVPGIYFLFAFLYLFFAKTIILYKIFLLLVNIFTSFLVYKISERFKKGSGIFASLIYLLVIIFYQGNYLIAEPFVAAFLAGSLFFLLNFFDSKRTKVILISGLLAAVAVFFKQTAILSFLPLLCWLYFRERKVLTLLYFLLPGVVIFVLWGAYLWRTNSFMAAYNQVITLNLTSYPREPLSKVVPSLLQTGSRVWFIWAAFLLFAFSKNKDKKLMLLLALIPIPAYLFRDYPHYWLQSLPFIAVGAGIGLLLFLERSTKMKYPVLLLALFTLLLSSSWFLWVTQHWNYPKMKEEKELTQFIENREEEYLLAESQYSSQYFLNSKKPLTKFLYITEITDARDSQEIIREGMKTKEVIIIWPDTKDYTYAKGVEAEVEEGKVIKSFKNLEAKVFLLR